MKCTSSFNFFHRFHQLISFGSDNLIRSQHWALNFVWYSYKFYKNYTWTSHHLGVKRKTILGLHIILRMIIKIIFNTTTSYPFPIIDFYLVSLGIESKFNWAYAYISSNRTNQSNLVQRSWQLSFIYQHELW